MISNEIDTEHWRRQLAQRRRIQIPDFLQTQAADYLAEELSARVPWQLSQRVDGQEGETPRGAYPDDAAHARMLDHGYARLRARDAGAAAESSAIDRFQFAFDSYMLAQAAIEGWDPDLAVHRVMEFLNTPSFLDFARYLSGDRDIVRVSAQCTRYRPGHYLMPHNDEQSSEQRRYAYVINLSRGWMPDWGGQLQFLDDDGSIAETFLPRWNSLSLFRVPQSHQVTLVAPWALRPRHAITGWWLAS